MRRLVPATSLVCLLAALAFLLSCSSGTSTHVVNNPIPASVALSPGPNANVELGKTFTFSATAANAQGATVPEVFTYQSSDPSVLTVSNGGIACGGVWDSVAAPVVCTPKGTGVALVTAIANGVSSPPVTVYVHQHVTKAVIQKVPGQPPTLSTSCYSSGTPLGPESALYQAFAFGGPSGLTDLTSTVGPFVWGATSLPGQTVRPVTLTSPGASAPTNQQIATASAPGLTSIFATVAGVTSPTLQFTTCPVQSISLQLAPGSSPSLVIPGGTAATVNAVVKDTVGMALIDTQLTWTSTSPQSVGVARGATSVFGSTAIVTAAAAGRVAITAACTPPTCNSGFSPSMPVYSTTSLTFQATSNSAPPNPTVYVTTSACSATTLSCTTRIVPITKSSSASGFSAGAPVTLPFTPNSFALGTTSTGISYLGVDSTGFNAQGLMIFSGSAASPFPGAAGRVLAVSPDSTTVILSDTADTPSRVNVCRNCSGTGRTLSTILFPNATAAAFSPDNLKVYLVSSSPCPGGGGIGCILVYSQVDSPQFVPLSAPASDAAFIGNGTAGFIAESGQTQFLPTCGPNAVGSLGSANLAAESLRPLPDGLSLLALTPPNLQTVTASITGSATPGAIGCPAPRGFLNITNTLGPQVSLGTGSFVTKQFFLSPDGTKAYILAQTGTGAYFPFITAFDVLSGTSSQISLAGNAIPLAAGVSRAGDLLLVGANDNSVHVIDTASGLDLQQVPLSFPNASLCVGPGSPATQVAIASLTISSAQQSGTNTIFAYSLQNGATPQAGQTLVLTGMSDSGNNGTFTILAVNAATSSSGTITVSNPAGVTASGQAGAGTVPLACNPDLLVSVP